MACNDCEACNDCDGAGGHSPFTEALLRYIETPGLDVRQMLSRLRAAVIIAPATSSADAKLRALRVWTEAALRAHHACGGRLAWNS